MGESRIETKSFEETQSAGSILSKQITPGVALLLYGDLGSGKTTFVQGLAKGLGIEQRIISPTFIIARKYEIKGKSLYHIDLYRTQTEVDLKNIGLGELLEDKNAIVVIEWPEKLGKLLPEKRTEIHFRDLGGNRREIMIHSKY